MLSGMDAQESRTPSAAGPENGGWRWREQGINVALIGLALLFLLALAGFVVYHSDLILPGVEAVGVDLGGMLRSKAAAALQEAWQQKTIAMRAGEATWTVAPSALGIELDVQAMVAAAYQQSRTWAGIRRWVRGGERIALSPVLHVDALRVERSLRQIAPELAVAPQDATVRVAGGGIEAVPAVPGQELDVAATTAWLELSAHQVVVQGVLDLRIRSLPPGVTDVSVLIEQGNQWLSHTLSVRAYDPIRDESLEWAVAPEEWIPWLSLRIDRESASGLAWTLSEALVREALQARAMELGDTRYLDVDQVIVSIERAIADDSWAVRTRIYHTPRLHVVQFGETLSSIARDYGMPYPWLEEANPGVKNTLSVGQVLTIPSPDALLPLPVVENKRIVVSISRQVMWAYQDGAARWMWPISTGIASSPTSPGVFQIQSHEENAYAASWDLWMPYFMGIYRPVPASNFMNGFHGFPTRDGATLLWTGNLGAPVTFGCILVETGNAAALYAWAEEGVIVEILP
ncbi:MAG: L,D-transpeptidase family protein [Anaerolineae bacterium]|nr:L,D-transpeptidase family protein [Anaerolineae bacterium]